MDKDKAQEIVDGLESASAYLPDDLARPVEEAIQYFVDQFGVISDDTELVYTGGE